MQFTRARHMRLRASFWMVEFDSFWLILVFNEVVLDTRIAWEFWERIAANSPLLLRFVYKSRWREIWIISNYGIEIKKNVMKEIWVKREIWIFWKRYNEHVTRLLVRFSSFDVHYWKKKKKKGKNMIKYIYRKKIYI